MSGLAAIIHFDGKEVEQGAIERLTFEMHYRGPDGIFYEHQRDAALAFCALHTTAESKGTIQPFKSDDGSLVLIFDGHLHNLHSLSKELAAKGARFRLGSDAEVALRAFEIWREGCALRMEGEFALVVWDSRRKEAFCARDHAGLKPLHYHWNGATLVVASDVGAVLVGSGVAKEFDDVMVAQILANEWISRGRTIWKGIERLKPATWARFDRSGVRHEVYWQPPAEVTIRYAKDEDYIEHYRDMFAECVRQSSRSHLPIGSDVSGGLDSSAVFAMAQDLNRKGRLLSPDIRGYTYRTEPGTSLYELDYARAVAEKVQAQVREIDPFRPELEWFLHRANEDRDMAQYPNAAMAITIGEELVSNGSRVTLNGEGGDEFLTGRPYYYSEQLSELDWASFTRSLREDISDIGFRSTAYRVARFGLLPFLPQATRRWMRHIAMPKGPNHHDGAFWLEPSVEALLDRCRATADHSHYRAIANPARRMMMTSLEEPFGELSRDQLDRQSARIGYERRTPMYSRKFIEFAFATPERIRMNGSTLKSIHIAALSSLLPAKVLKRKTKAEFALAFERYLDKMQVNLTSTIPQNSFGFLNPVGMRKLYEQYEFQPQARPIWELWGAFACFGPMQLGSHE